MPDYDRAFQYDTCHFTHAGDKRMARNFLDAIVKKGSPGPPK